MVLKVVSNGFQPNSYLWGDEKPLRRFFLGIFTSSDFLKTLSKQTTKEGPVGKLQGSNSTPKASIYDRRKVQTSLDLKTTYKDFTRLLSGF